MRVSLFKSCLLMTTILALSACETLEGVQEKPKRSLSPVSYSEIDGWGNEDYLHSLAAFQKSCARILKSPADKKFGLGTVMKDWQVACQNLSDPTLATPESAKAYFENWFAPYAVAADDKQDGLFTGYYEASLNGSLVRGGQYQTPLRARPTDLVMVNLGEFVPSLKGQRIAGRVKNGQLKPYEDRAAIEKGKLPKDMDVPLYWVDSAVDAFFLQVQGSGIVTLPDGTTARVGYDGQNGHPYTAIGKELIARGALTKDNVSMQSIREWLAANPKEAADVMRTNKSYVFFKKLETDGPVGAEGVTLTPEASLAVDSSVWPYGVPMYLEAPHPDGAKTIQRLMVAQDTGGAIRGIIRGDFFWGYGHDAAHNAGLMQSTGKLWVLIPKNSKPTLKEE